MQYLLPALYIISTDQWLNSMYMTTHQGEQPVGCCAPVLVESLRSYLAATDIARAAADLQEHIAVAIEVELL